MRLILIKGDKTSIGINGRREESEIRKTLRECHEEKQLILLFVLVNPSDGTKLEDSSRREREREKETTVPTSEREENVG